MRDFCYNHLHLPDEDSEAQRSHSLKSPVLKLDRMPQECAIFFKRKLFSMYVCVCVYPGCMFVCV